jgi:imidazolonepropionase-like amidohydrolase
MKATLTKSLSILALAASPVFGFSSEGANDKLVIEAGRIITLAGEEIENGIIVIENGRITAIGKADEVKKPWDAPVIGGPDLVAFPGFVEAHTSGGLDRANESVQVAPFLNVADAIDPIAYYFEDCLRYGITTVNVQQGPTCIIGARGMIVRPVGKTIAEMVMRPEYGLKISVIPGRTSRATQVQALRKTFTDLESYLTELVTKENDKRGYAAREAKFQGRELDDEDNKGRAMKSSAWSVEGLEIIPRGAIDEKQAPLLDVVEGRRTVFLHCASSMDVLHALDIARSNGFLRRTVLVISPTCWKAADMIAEAGVPVVLEGGVMDIRRSAITGEELETFVPGVLAEKGIRFALSSQDSSQRSLWYQAALATGHGLSRDAAIDAVTRVPAEILGMGKEVGSLKKGMLGNVVLFSGDPLSITSWVEQVVIEGKPVYDRKLDNRNRHLLDGVQPLGTQGAAQAKSGDGEHHSTQKEDE